EAELAALVAKSRALRTVAETFEKSGALRLPQGMLLADVIDDSNLRSFLEGGFDPAPFRDRIKACLDRRRAEISGTFLDLDERALPTGLLEPIRLGDYSIRQDLYKDRGLFSLDEFGLGIEELLAAKATDK